MSLYESIMQMDPEQLAEFRRRLRRRYTPDEILDELRACARRLGTSPTMREFAADDEAGIHPQTVVEHFGSWNRAKRQAGLLPRRRATREELLAALRNLGDLLGRVPTGADIEANRGIVPSKGVYSKAFGSLRAALREAGYDMPTRSERLERSIEHGARFHLRTGRLPSFREWERIRKGRDDIMTSWQIYRAFDDMGGAWSAFQFAVTERAAVIVTDDEAAA